MSETAQYTESTRIHHYAVALLYNLLNDKYISVETAASLAKDILKKTKDLKSFGDTKVATKHLADTHTELRRLYIDNLIHQEVMLRKQASQEVDSLMEEGNMEAAEIKSEEWVKNIAEFVTSKEDDAAATIHQVIDSVKDEKTPEVLQKILQFVDVASLMPRRDEYLYTTLSEPQKATEALKMISKSKGKVVVEGVEKKKSAGKVVADQPNVGNDVPVTDSSEGSQDDANFNWNTSTQIDPDNQIHTVEKPSVEETLKESEENNSSGSEEQSPLEAVAEHEKMQMDNVTDGEQDNVESENTEGEKVESTETDDQDDGAVNEEDVQEQPEEPVEEVRELDLNELEELRRKVYFLLEDSLETTPEDEAHKYERDALEMAMASIRDGKVDEQTADFIKSRLLAKAAMMEYEESAGKSTTADDRFAMIAKAGNTARSNQLTAEQYRKMADDTDELTRVSGTMEIEEKTDKEKEAYKAELVDSFYEYFTASLEVSSVNKGLTKYQPSELDRELQYAQDLLSRVADLKQEHRHALSENAQKASDMVKELIQIDESSGSTSISFSLDQVGKYKDSLNQLQKDKQSVEAHFELLDIFEEGGQLYMGLVGEEIDRQAKREARVTEMPENLPAQLRSVLENNPKLKDVVAGYMEKKKDQLHDRTLVNWLNELIDLFTVKEEDLDEDSSGD